MDLLGLLRQHPAVFQTFRLANGLVLLAILLAPLEHIFARRPRKFLRRGLSTDVAYYFLTSLLPNRLLVLPLAAVALAVQTFIPPGVHAWTLGLPVPVRIAAALLVAEIGFYWGHRWMHS